VGRRTGEAGVATGLAWTPVGGDVLFVEATAFPGEGKLQVTGQLGDVMKESAAAALSYVKHNVASLGEDVPEDWFRKNDVHLHVPAGAIPKDGPSAGVTMATALASLVSGRPVRSDTAMTGEITLKGLVLPIGGLKEKALAAQRAGISRVIAPGRNAPDAEDFPANLKRAMEFRFVDSADEVLAEALEPAGGQRVRRARSSRAAARPKRGRARDPVAAATGVAREESG
jgi:ATP-dependent Lon protease